MRRKIIYALVALVAGCALTAKEKSNEPVPFGMLNGNSGCVIFEESRAVKGKWLAVGAVVTGGQLRVIDSIDYDLQPKVWPETQENIDKLMKLSVKDKLKYLKVAKGYTPEILAKARKMCSEDLTPQ